MAVSQPGDNTAYEYDGDGTRVSKTRDGVKTKYINDIARRFVQVLMETDNAGIVQAIYTYGNSLISMNRAGTNSYYHYDGLGTVKQVTNNSEAVVASYTYDGFGNLIASTGTINNPYGFTGEQQFGETDSLVFLRARYYKPSIGRFIRRDPIGYADGLNLYAYAKNNPVNLRDPSGKKGCAYQCITFGVQGMLYGVVSGECAYICRGVCVDSCGNVTYSGPHFMVVPVDIFGLGYCPFYAIIIDTRPVM